MNNHDFKDLQVVIVNWCRSADTIECINSILRSHCSVNNILVIDNGSSDDSISQIAGEFPEINIMSLSKNLGFAGGFNHGIKAALKTDATKIMILNNDTIVDQDTLPQLLLSKWDISVPKIYFNDQPMKIWSAGADWRRFPPMVVMRGYQQYDNERYEKSCELEYATGCALMINRIVFETIGYFDEQYINYFEDYDFIFRARKAGFHIGYIPEAKVWHKVAQSMGIESAQRLRFMGRNSVLFYRNNQRFSIWMYFSYLIWVSIRELLKFNFQQIRQFWMGVFDGMKWLEHGNSSM